MRPRGIRILLDGSHDLAAGRVKAERQTPAAGEQVQDAWPLAHGEAACLDGQPERQVHGVLGSIACSTRTGWQPTGRLATPLLTPLPAHGVILGLLSYAPSDPPMPPCEPCAQDEPNRLSAPAPHCERLGHSRSSPPLQANPRRPRRERPSEPGRRPTQIAQTNSQIGTNKPGHHDGHDEKIAEPTRGTVPNQPPALPGSRPSRARNERLASRQAALL